MSAQLGRRALLQAGPTCLLGMLGACTRAAPPVAVAEASHKFDRPTRRPPTYRQRLELEYASHFIPFARLLEQELGRERVVESLRRFAMAEARELAEQIRQQGGPMDLSLFRAEFNPANPMLTARVLEDSTRVWCIEIEECLWADVWRSAGAAELGLAAVCAGDAPFATAVNPAIRMDLQGTLMEGKPSCVLRYHYV